MNLRKLVRRTITGGGILRAVVESYVNGRVTVRLAPKGARLTNLSAIGQNLSVGQPVLVDYSAGVEPIVRSAIGETTVDPEPDLLQPEVGSDLIEVDDEDYSAYGWWYSEDIDEYHLYQGVPLVYFFGPWYPAWEVYQQYGAWDSSNHLGWYGKQRSYMEVLRTGKYLISGSWNYDLSEARVSAGGGAYATTGHTRLRILRNGSPIASKPVRDHEESRGFNLLSIITIRQLSQGDLLELELMQTLGPDYWMGNYATDGPYTALSLCIVYIPGTE